MVTKKYLENHGRPLAPYTDRGSVFAVNSKNKDRKFITHFERALNELDIKLIKALSPQAKGRAERGFATDQDRLVKLMRFRNIATIEESNRYIQRVYLVKRNSKHSLKEAKRR